MFMPLFPSAANSLPDEPGLYAIFLPTAATTDMPSVICMPSGESAFCTSPTSAYRQEETLSADTTKETVSMPEGVYSTQTPWRSKSSSILRREPISELSPDFDAILRANGIEEPIERVEAVVGMMKMKKINFIKELWPLCDFFFIRPAYQADDKFTRKNWKEDTAAEMRELAALLEPLTDFSVESQKAVVDAWAAESGKKPWNPWRVCLFLP